MSSSPVPEPTLEGIPAEMKALKLKSKICKNEKEMKMKEKVIKEDNDADMDDVDMEDEGEGDEDQMGSFLAEKGKKNKVIKAQKDPKEKVIREASTRSAGSGAKTVRKTGGKSKSNKELNFSTHISKVLKQVHPNIGVTKQGMKVLNDLVCSAFYNISEEAGKLCKMSRREALSERDMESAVNLILDGGLAKHATNEGKSAVTHYRSSCAKQKAERSAAAGAEGDK